jgi:hypothetical protein
MRGLIGTRLMSANSNDVIQKKRGRPAIGQDPVLSFRIPPHFRDTIDDWRSRERDQPSQSKLKSALGRVFCSVVELSDMAAA